MIGFFDNADSLLSGPFWFAGCVLLGGGALVAWFARTPSWRVRIAELSFVGMLAWFVLALVPMPRMGQVEPLLPEPAPVAVVSATPELQVPPLMDPAQPLVTPENTAAAAPAWRLPTVREVWLACAVLTLLFLLFGAVMLMRLLLRSRPAGADVQLLANQIGARLGLTKPACVRVHARLRAPFCCRVRTVVLPEELLRDRDALRAVLAHELAHVAANDPLRRSMMAALLPFFVLHPGFWLLRRLSTQASEEAADARAALALGRAAKNYARPLIELSERLGQQGVAPLHPSIVGVLGQPTSFTRRMTMLLTRDPQLAVRSLSRRQGLLATTSTLLALSLSVGAWGTPAAAQSRVSANADVQDPRAKSPLDCVIRPDFRDCRLRDALRKVAQQTSLRMAIDTDVAARKIKIGRLALDKMPARRLLDTLAVAHGLRWQMEEGRVVFRMALPKTVAIDGANNFLDNVAGFADHGKVALPPETITYGRLDRNGNVNVNTAPEEVQNSLVPQALFNQGRLQEAVRQADQQLQVDPSRVDLLTLRAHALRMLGDEAGAKATLNRANSFLDTQSNSRMIDAATRALRGVADPESGRTVIERAHELLDQGRTMRAIEECEQQLRKDPTRTDLLRLQADAWRLMGDEEAARRSLQRAKALEPDEKVVNKVPLLGEIPLIGNVFRNAQDPAVVKNRAQEFYNQGRMQEALREANRMLELKPDNAKLWYLHANVLQAMGDQNRALQSFNKALKLDPDSVIDKVEMHRGPDNVQDPLLNKTKSKGRRKGKVRVPKSSSPEESPPQETPPEELPPEGPNTQNRESAAISNFTRALFGRF